ncbi:hypothetical protein V6N13_000995 [Hibiscus sabdariffa]|uniref:Uncharacterized protein n=1 Tax=Hibiscus sabdariffa TaxID=183260 RepID=A0ABR2G7C5_9ROSI
MFQKLEVDRSVHLGNVFAVEVYRSDYIVRMGRKADALYINPKKFGSLTKPCMKEMSTMNRKPWGSINYHLQRLNRGRK